MWIIIAALVTGIAGLIGGTLFGFFNAIESVKRAGVLPVVLAYRAKELNYLQVVASVSPKYRDTFMRHCRKYPPKAERYYAGNPSDAPPMGIPMADLHDGYLH